MSGKEGVRPLTIVTGASRGIGRAIALALADAGHDLALVCRDRAQDLDEAAAGARAKGASVSTHFADVSDPGNVDGLFAALAGKQVHGLVNNAAYPGERGALADLALAEIDRVLSVNVRGPILMARGALKLMSQGSAIVNLSSQSAQFGGTGLTAYATSKAAVNGLTVSLARELAGAGIRVNAVSPGPVLTEPLRALPPARLKEMEAALPMGRFCTEEEVAALVVWLLSDKASYVSGAIVPVHGAR